MITSRKSRKTGNTVLMFDFQPEKTVYQAVIELTIDGKSKIIPFRCTGRDCQRFMKDIELESASSPVTISYILTTTLTGKTERFKDSETNLKIISETESSVTLIPERERGSKTLLIRSKKFPFRKTSKMSPEDEDRLVKEYEQIILSNPELMQAIEFIAQGSSDNEEVAGNSDDLDVLNLARQIDDNASDEEISKKLFNLVFNEKSEEEKISECLEKIEELASECISDSANIEKHFEKFKKYIFNNTNLLGKMSPENYSYVRKLIRTVKSLMSACKKITSKKSRSEALRKFCDKTELDDNVQSIQNITKKMSEKSSKNFSNNSVNTEKVSEKSLNNSEKSLNNLKNSEKVEKVSENSETNSDISENVLNNSETSLQNSEKSSNSGKSLNNSVNSEEVEKVSENLSNNSETNFKTNSEINSFNYVQGISTNLSENIAGFT